MKIALHLILLPLTLCICAKPPLGLWLNRFLFARSADVREQSAKAQTATMQRWHQPSDPLNWCYFSGFERAFR